MRILIWHGYLLGGTGSNVYTRSLARAWSALGHEVFVVCQEPHPEEHDVGSAEVICPDIGPVLPVFVRDKYEGFDVKLLNETTWAERRRVVEANAIAMRELLPVDYTLTNHILLGAAVGVQFGEQFSVKVHGSELEYAIRDDPDLERWARVSLSGAREIYVGSQHVKESLLETLGPGPYLARTREVSPGVDVDLFRPRAREDALRELIAQAQIDSRTRGAHSDRLPDVGNAERFKTFFAEDRPTIGYVGKLSHEKGVHILLDALKELDARAVIVGFGPDRDLLQKKVVGQDVLFTGALEHRHLAALWPLCDVAVVPSIFPEAFGMVAAEAAASGVPPVVAHHSGLTTVSKCLEENYPLEIKGLSSFLNGNAEDLIRVVGSIFSLSIEQRKELANAARKTAVEHWSWEGVAVRLIEGIPFRG